jgi:hypothetical protein
MKRVAHQCTCQTMSTALLNSEYFAKEKRLPQRVNMFLHSRKQN